MDWKIIVGIICVLYAAVVSFLAYKKTPWLIKMVKMKLGKNMSDKSAINTCFVASGVFFIAGIVLFIL